MQKSLSSGIFCQKKRQILLLDTVWKPCSTSSFLSPSASASLLPPPTFSQQIALASPPTPFSSLCNGGEKKEGQSGKLDMTTRTLLFPSALRTSLRTSCLSLFGGWQMFKVRFICEKKTSGTFFASYTINISTIQWNFDFSLFQTTLQLTLISWQAEKSLL